MIPSVEKKKLEGITMPRFQDFIDGAKNIDYKNIMNISVNIKEYKKNTANQLKDTVKKEGAFTMATEKTIFQKTVCENIAAQELF